jgi:hypothetical protein
VKGEVVSENQIEKKVVAPDETRGIGADIAVGVVSGAAGGVAGAVAQQVIDKIKPGKKK